MKTIQYITSGTCSKMIDILVDDDDCVRSVKFYGGCHGNLQGIGKLVEGMKRKEVIKRLEGIKCGTKQTSCPDQLSQALKEIV